MMLRLAAAVAGSMGLVGLLLAAIGVYGVTAFAVVRRTREIGIRVVLGAQRGDVWRMVLRDGMWLVAIGCTAGIGLAIGASSCSRPRRHDWRRPGRRCSRPPRRSLRSSD